MAVAVLTRIVVVDDSLYRGPKGQVFDWVGKVTRLFASHARGAIHSRSGELRRGVRAGTPRNPSRKTVQGTIGSTAPHTMYVLRGTTGPIMSTIGWGLKSSGQSLTYTQWYIDSRGRRRARQVPKPGSTMAVGRRPWPPTTPMFAVSGQKANNFMATAWRRTARRHRGIGGVPGRFMI